MSITSHIGNPPDLPNKPPLSWQSLAAISTCFPVMSSHNVALSASFVTA
jgi:hypothetical protein